jgi:predicted MPP superfamily phosphohydrolase
MALLTRRRFLGALFCGGAAVAADMALIEPEALRTSEWQVPLSGAPGRAPLRLLHLSDFHASNCVSLDFIEQAVERGLATSPDLICLTGDFISWRWEEWTRYAEILGKLSARAPAFAVLGNHDGGRWAASSRHRGYPDASLVRELLAAANITLLHNSAVSLQAGEWPLHMAGLGDLYNREMDAEAAFSAPAPPGATTILLSHNPDTKDLLKDQPWQLMLCGHTHGGQCRLPFIGTPFAPVKDHRYVEGLHSWEQRWIHITRGVGNLHGLRFNCRPEVSVLTLT